MVKSGQPYTINDFRSASEYNLAIWLDKQKVRWEYEPHHFKYKSRIKQGRCETCGGIAVQERDYTPDFWFPEFGFYVEYKGNFTSHDRKKMRDFKKSHPEIDIRMLLGSNNLLEAGNRDGGRYSDWCEKFGFKYALRAFDIKWITAGGKKI